jgi:hypothetical protein
VVVVVVAVGVGARRQRQRQRSAEQMRGSAGCGMRDVGVSLGLCRLMIIVSLPEDTRQSRGKSESDKLLGRGFDCCPVALLLPPKSDAGAEGVKRHWIDALMPQIGSLCPCCFTSRAAVKIYSVDPPAPLQPPPRDAIKEPHHSVHSALY